MALPLLAGLGTLFQAVGSISAGDSQARAAEQEAQRRRLQADEVEHKAVEDERVFRQQGREFLGEQASAYAKSGVLIEGSPLMQLQDTKFKMEQQVTSQRRASAFYASQLRSGADSQMDQAGGFRTAGFISGIGGVLTGAARLGSIEDKNTFKGSGGGSGGLSSGGYSGNYQNKFGNYA